MDTETLIAHLSEAPGYDFIHEVLSVRENTRAGYGRLVEVYYRGTSGEYASLWLVGSLAELAAAL
jgi:hypothetical protein